MSSDGAAVEQLQQICLLVIAGALACQPNDLVTQIRPNARAGYFAIETTPGKVTSPTRASVSFCLAPQSSQSCINWLKGANCWWH